MRLLRILAPLLAALAVAAPAAPVQTRVVEVGSTPTCRGCRIVFTRVATLGGADDPVSPDERVTVARDSRGRFYVTPTADRRRVAVYDARGRFVRTLGREGSGPGEFRFPVEVQVGPGDSVHVFDLGTERLTTFDAALQVARTVSLPVVGQQHVRLPGGRILMNVDVPTRAAAGLPLHLVSSDGELVRSFGADTPVVDRRRPWLTFRALAPASASAVWSGHFNRYRVELWDTSGAHRLTLARRPAWFPSWDARPPGRRDQVRPLPTLAGVRQDERGLLWTFSQVADAGWRPAPGAGRRDPRREQPALPPADYDRYLDTRIEVIDPHRGTLLVSGQLDRYYHPPRGGGNLVHSIREGPDGDTRVDVWTMRLVIPPEEEP